MEKKSQKYGIIGGGILGMTLALRLRQAGNEVTLFEASDRAGGLASEWEMDGITWDRFYHVILLSDLNTRRLIEEIGLSDQLNWVETKTGFYSSGRLHSMSNILEFFRFPPINLVDKFRLGLTIFVASKIRNWKRLEGMYVEEWLRKWSGNRVFEKIWLPLLRSKLGDHYKESSAAFIWATIQRMYAARKSGLKKEMFGYLSGGYQTFNLALAEKLKSLGVVFRLNARVEMISRESEDRVKIKLGEESYLFDKVISTLPANLSIKIAPGLTGEEKEKWGKIRYLGVICPSILLDKPISPYYVTNITDPGAPFTGVIEMTALIDPAELEGNHLVYLPKYAGPDDPLFQQDDDQLKETFMGELYRMYPWIGEENLKFWGVSRAREVFALPSLNYSSHLPGSSTSIKNFYIVNSAQIINGTLNVNETIKVAESKVGSL